MLNTSVLHWIGEPIGLVKVGCSFYNWQIVSFLGTSKILGLISKQFEEYHQTHDEKKKSYPFIPETILFAAYACFVGLAIFTTLLLYSGYLSVSVTVLMVSSFFLCNFKFNTA